MMVAAEHLQFYTEYLIFQREMESHCLVLMPTSGYSNPSWWLYVFCLENSQLWPCWTLKRGLMAAPSFRWILQLHKDIPKAAKFYSQGLDFSVNVCSLRWAELQSGSLKLALMQSPSDHVMQSGYSSLLSFTVADMNNTVTKLMALGAELDGPIKHEIHGKVAAMRCVDGHMIGLYEPV